MLSSCSWFVKTKTEFTIPPKHLVVQVNWPFSDVPIEEMLKNTDLIKYTQSLEQELKIQENNYVEFNKWRDGMVAKEKEVNEKEK